MLSCNAAFNPKHDATSDFPFTHTGINIIHTCKNLYPNPKLRLQETSQKTLLPLQNRILQNDWSISSPQSEKSMVRSHLPATLPSGLFLKKEKHCILHTTAK